jgi:hypothetical protein
MEEDGSQLYLKVVKVTSDYLGPASRRFIDRQIANHLNKDPEELNEQDLTTLIKWIEISMSILTEDRLLVSEFTERLGTLSNNKQRAG